MTAEISNQNDIDAVRERIKKNIDRDLNRTPLLSRMTLRGIFRTARNFLEPPTGSRTPIDFYPTTPKKK